jgi:alkylated DNA nucleotide flippase Atl1
MLHNRDDVPAHRVVNRNGLLTGKFHFDGTNLMQQLLESEGIVVENQIIDFEKHFLNQSSFSISINGLLNKLMSFY